MSDEYTRCTVQNERGVFERDVIESRIWVVVFINSSKWDRKHLRQPYAVAQSRSCWRICLRVHGLFARFSGSTAGQK